MANDNKLQTTDIATRTRESNHNPQWGGVSSSIGESGPSLTIKIAHGPTLESAPHQYRLKKLMAFRQQARIQQADNRMEMAIDEDFYDSIQLDQADLNVLLERKQPILTYNVIKDTINWMLGMEKKVRIDYNIRPRNRGDEADCKVKTEIFKFDSDVNHAEYMTSRAFASAVKAGVGWLDIGARNNEDSPLFIRDEKWRNVWFDHLSTDLTRSNARFLIREKYVDLDIAQVLFEDRKDDLVMESQHVNNIYPYNPDDMVISDPASEFDVEGQIDSITGPRGDILRERVKIVECWYRMPAKVTLLRQVDKGIPWGSLEGTIYRKGNADHDYLVKNGYFKSYEAMRMIVRCAFWCGRTYLKDVLSPYNHWEFPLIPIWCYIRERDNMPYGVIRDLRDPQIDLNKRRSKALFLLSAAQVIAEKGAVDDKQEALSEVQRPDGYVEVNINKKFEIVRNLDLGNVHLNMAHDDERFIRSIAGHIEPDLVNSKKEISGVAANTMKEGTQITSGVVFDNYYLALQLAGEVRLSLVEQLRDREEEILISAGNKNQRFEVINKLKEDGTVQNSITRSKARFIIGKQDYRESVRMAMFQTLSEILMFLAKTAPQVALNVLDLVVEFMDDLGPIKEDLVERIRKINKQHAPKSELSEEELKQVDQQDQMMKQKEAQIQAIQMAMSQAQLKAANAKADSDEAKAIKQKIEATVKQLEGFIQALELSNMMQMNTTAVGAADVVIAEARKAVMPAPTGGEPQQGGNRQVGGTPQGGM